MEARKKRYKRIEILRDISCILVLLYHLNILKGGFLAVCTFLVLSGYLTCLSALENNNFSIKDYYLKRLKRLYLPLVVVVFITIILIKINSAISYINMKPETTSVLLGYNNIWQINANLDYFTRNISSPFMHLWYISILLQFELIFPIVFMMFRKIEIKIRKNISVIVIAIITALTTLLFWNMSKTQDIMIVYYNTFARSFSIFFGILLALIHYKYRFKLSQLFSKFNKIIFALYSIALISLCIFIPEDPSNYAIYMIIATVISTRLIAYSTIDDRTTGKFDKPIKILSKISYEVYLVQYPVIFFMKSIPMNEVLKTILIIAVVFIVSFILQLLMNFPLRSKLAKGLKAICISAIIVGGCFILITEKDYSAEMKELENRLSENSKIIEEKNREYEKSKVAETVTNIEKEEQVKTEKSKEEIVIVKEEEEKTPTEEKKKENMTKEEIDEAVSQLPVVGIGDSVLLGAIDEFYAKFPNGYFDGKISRNITASKELLNSLIAEGRLGNIVILALATNGDYSDRVNEGLMEILGDREIYWINAVGADDPEFNDRFKEFAKNYPNIHIVDWEKAAQNHPEYFYPDGIHTQGPGLDAYVNTVFETICENHQF